MRNRHAASRFLDLVAGVDDEEDEEEDELDELEEEEEYLEEADLHPYERPVSNAFHDQGGGGDAAAELDEAFDALLKRSKQRDAEDRTRTSTAPFDGRDGYTTQFCATSVLRRQVDVPGPEDVPMYSIQVKRGKEEVVAFRLSNKAIKTNMTDVLSILALTKKVPGRIYVEARKSAPIQLLFEGLHFVYPSLIFMVPIAERAALLQPIIIPPPIKRGDFVKVRNGLYKNDLGEVVDVSDGNNTCSLVVKVKGREPDPRELKRKRSQNSIRREPSVYDKEELRRLHFFDRDFDFTDLGEDGFEFGGKRYTNDGYYLLKIRYDRVERVVQRTMAQLGPHLSDDLGRTSNGALIHKKPSFSSSSLCSSADLPRSLASSIPKFIRPGVRVRITAGASAGAIVHVIDVKSSSPPYSALVQLQPTRPKNHLHHQHHQQNSTTTTAGAAEVPINFDIEIAYLTRTFEIGDHVEVKVGELRGRVGMVVSSVVEEGEDGRETLHVVDSKELLEFQVLSTFVDTYEPRFVRLAPADAPEPDFRLGSPVKIIRGKHGGKTGRIVVIQNDHHIRVLEYVTDIELVVRRDNVEPFVENVLTKPVYIPSRSPVSQVSKRGQKVPQSNEKEKEKAIVAVTTKKSDPPPSAVTPTPSTFKQDDSQNCFLDHLKYGFNDQIVYAWRGPFKGRFGKCLHMSGLLAGVSLGSAIQGEGVTYILRSCLVARCGCVLADDVKLPWTMEEKADIPVMFENWETEIADAARPKTPPSVHVAPTPQFHDSEGPGMWLFHPKVAQIRKQLDIIVNINSYSANCPDGPREGQVLADPTAPSHPMRYPSPPNVRVRFVRKPRNETVVDPIPAYCLSAKVKGGGDHVVFKGDRVGMLVTHLKTDGLMARVVPVGRPNKYVFYMEKDYLCAVERS